jgi:hypothetical protein
MMLNQETISSPMLDAPASPAFSLPRPRLPWRTWLREPLLHFLVLGGILFGIDHLVARGDDDPLTIVVGAEVDRDARATFKAVRGQAPSAQELEALRQVWLDNEVLYREGLALQVDRGDSAIRERVIFKALSVVDSNVKLAPPSDQVLRQWFEGHREKYDEPARFDFEEAALAGGGDEPKVRAFVAALNAGAPGDSKAGLRVFKGRPRANLVQSYGAAFAAALEKAPPGQWQAIKATDGWRAMRLGAITPPRPGVFEALRGVVFHDWSDAIAAEQRTAAVRALTKKYRVVREGP